MKPIFIICTLLLSATVLNAQKSLDTKIVVILPDTNNLYERVRLALVEEDFIVKENNRKDTLLTHPNNIGSTSFVTAVAAIKDNTVTLWGFIGDANLNMLGITVNPSKKDYQKIFYYKHDKYWHKLMSVAKKLDGTLSYEK